MVRRLSQADADRLMDDLAAGDLQALERLYDAYVPLVYSIAHRVLRDDTAAQDIVQITFLKVWRSARAYQPGNITSWLVRIARNAALDVLRRQRDVPCEFDDARLFAATDFESEFVRAIECKAVLEALAALPNQVKILIELGFFEGFTHVEIADHVGLPLGTVKTRIRNGLLQLRALLAESLRESGSRIVSAPKAITALGE